MKSNVKKSIIATFILIGVLVSWVTFAEALDVRLLWKKEFRHQINSSELATETGDILIRLSRREAILLDKNGNERFHWGPRIDRGVTSETVSKDGKYFAFSSGYTEDYAFRKGLEWSGDDRIHFYDRQTKKELWNKRDSRVPLIFPDGLSLIAYEYTSGVFSIYDRQGKTIYDQKQETGRPSIMISPDSNYFVLIKNSMGPLVLYKRDGAKLWETGRHDHIASISEGASYTSTEPYSLGLSYTADSLNSQNGIVYDKNGSKILEGLGVLSGNGERIAMIYPNKVSILTLPNKGLVKELALDMKEIFRSNDSSNVCFSYNGRYIFLKSGLSLWVHDLQEEAKKEIKIPGSNDNPTFSITSDGKYLLINPEYPKEIYYYQVY